VVRCAVVIPEWRVGGQVEQPAQVRGVLDPRGPDWNNSTVLNGDLVSEVSKLKQELDGDIVVFASFQIVHTLMEHDLVDELRLKVFLVVLGAGERLFGETSDKKPMRLVDSQTLDSDVAYLTYERVRDA
jgi:dihydrofolate reductase